MSSAQDPAAAGASAVPVCFRHPDRESHVRCQRCDRPVCPQCQRQAPVGVHCPECARKGAQQVRAARTVLGGRLTGGRPVATLTLIGLCVAVYVLQQVPGLAVTDRFAFTPALAGEEPWRFLTAAFLHGTGSLGVPHLLLNCFALWMAGAELEDDLGRARFVALYLVSALAGSVGFELLTPDLVQGGYVSTVGASGAVFGLFAAILVVRRRFRREQGPIVSLLAVMLVLGFYMANVAWQAHLGGLAGGAAVGLVLVRAPRERRGLWQWAGIGAVAVVLVLLAAVGLSVG